MKPSGEFQSQVRFPLIWSGFEPRLKTRTATPGAAYYPFPAICGFAVFADSVLRLTLTSEHPSNVVNKFELHVLTNTSLILGGMTLILLQNSRFVF